MKELAPLNPTVEDKNSGNRSNNPKFEGPFMLDEVLQQEYRELGIFTQEEFDLINDFRVAKRSELNILKFSEAQKKSLEEQQFQLLQRAKLRNEVLKEIRRILHRSSARRYYRVFDKYERFFSTENKNFDEKILTAAAHLATIKEIKDGIETKSEKDGLKIYNRAVVLVDTAENGDDELNEQITEIKQREKTQPVSAICFSGGGIRSATFGLGVLQGLAKHGLLDDFHYLSTVSGGGYIGSWLSAWIYQRRKFNESSDNIADSSNSPQTEEFDFTTVRQIQETLNTHTAALPEPPEITHLRTFSNYLSPKTGLFTTDTWTLIAVYIRNLLLNWTVLIPLLAAALLVPILFVDLLKYHEFINPNYSLFYLSLTFVIGLAGICFINMLRPSLKDYTFKFLDQGFKTDDIGAVKASTKAFFLCVLPTILMAIGAVTYWYWINKSEYTKPNFLFFILFGVLLFLGGYLISWALMFGKYRKFWKSPEGKRKFEQSQQAEKNCFGENKTSAWQRFKLFFKTYLSEPILTIFCGTFGGALLYLAANNLTPVGYPEELIVCFGIPVFLIVLLLATTFFIGLAVKITYDDDREWLARFGAVLSKFIVGWSIISSAVIFGPKLFDLVLSNQTWWGQLLKVGGVIFPVVSGIFSVMAGFSGSTPAAKGEPAKDWSGYLLPIASSILAPIFVLFLFVVIALGTEYLAEITNLNHTIWFVTLAILAAVMGIFININKFSFHATYRERLIRAYLGASNPDRLNETNSFIGFNTDQDNFEMKHLRQKPLHVLNMTLNLVNSDNLAWQNRKGQSFTVTPLHAGSSNMGKGIGNYRNSGCYGFNKQNDKAITLGTSMAISGAAASPNMGYFTQSAAVSFLMVLLNVRLGWWLGNPGRRGDSLIWKSAVPSWKKSAPSWSPKTFIAESLGLTDDRHKYVYLADGGQFENLGLYEMVLRRCKTIIVCDGGSDKEFTFFDLGSAIHKIRVDMGIPIEFEPETRPTRGRNCSIATIWYSTVDGCDERDNGKLIYIKPTLDGNQPIDIVQYQSVNPDFPHEGTLDQFYSETQFESYRKLGFEMIKTICKGGQNHREEPDNHLSIADFMARAEGYLEEIIEQEKHRSINRDKA